MKPEEIEFLILLREKINHIASRAEVDQEKVSHILDRFLRLSKDHLSVPAPVVSFSNDELKSIKSDTYHIRFAVDLLGDCSIDYSWITMERVRKQLTQDNLRMENSILSQEINESQRFYSFCTYAFYQIEELVNYYYFKKYTLEEFKKLLIAKNPSFTNFQKQIINDSDSLSRIESQKKLFVFENEFYYNQTNPDGSLIYYDSVIDKIRRVRNEDSHRCSVIEQDGEGVLTQYEKIKFKRLIELSEKERETKRKARLILFLRERNFNIVRDALLSVSRIVCDKNHI